MARSHVPQFGKWEAEENVPYTVFFDKARQGRGGKMINPNDPQENPEDFGSRAPPTRARTEQNERVQGGATHERKASREDRDRRASRASIGSEHGFDRSPLHPNLQPKITGRGNGSASGSTNAHGSTPGRTRLRGRDDGLDRGATVPPFGQWDEANPASGAGYTVMFDKVREEKHTGTPNITTETHDYSRPSHNNGHQKAKSRCFPWLR